LFTAFHKDFIPNRLKRHSCVLVPCLPLKATVTVGNGRFDRPKSVGTAFPAGFVTTPCIDSGTRDKEILGKPLYAVLVAFMASLAAAYFN